MKISIVMATFNGIKFIEQQLDSIRLQTLQPNEVIIRDDGSTDGTLVFIINYIEKHGLSNWFVKKNEINLGWRKNFIQLFKDATGEIIFLSDQDDIWNKKKIELMSNEFKEHPQIMLLTSDYEEILQGGASWDLEVYKSKRVGNSDLILTTLGTLRELRPGNGSAFRSSILPLVYLFHEFNDQMAHDTILEIITRISGNMYNFPQTVGKWRKYCESAFAKEDKITKSGSSGLEILKMRILNQQTRSLQTIQFIDEYKNKLPGWEKYYKFVVRHYRVCEQAMDFIDGKSFILNPFRIIPALGLWTYKRLLKLRFLK